MEKVASGIMNRKFEPPVVPPEAMSVSELLLEVKFLREAWKSGSAVNTSPCEPDKLFLVDLFFYIGIKLSSTTCSSALAEHASLCRTINHLH